MIEMLKIMKGRDKISAYELFSGVGSDRTGGHILRVKKRRVKVGFHGTRERFAKDANVEKMAKSNIRILGSKSSPNMRGGSEASSIVRRSRFLFGGNFKLF